MVEEGAAGGGGSSTNPVRDHATDERDATRAEIQAAFYEHLYEGDDAVVEVFR